MLACELDHVDWDSLILQNSKSNYIVLWILVRAWVQLLAVVGLRGLGGGGLGFGFFVFGNLGFAGFFFLGGEDGIG